MASYNDITGDKIATRTVTKEYGDNWDKIFGKKSKTEKEFFENGKEIARALDQMGDATPTTDKPVEPVQLELWTEEEERRLEIIGQNGNVGYGEEDNGSV